VILDTWADPALAANELIRGEPPVRFFAAYPLESLEGHRLGAFCIYDTVPREAQEVDLELLRDFALLAEAAITAPGSEG
jgi:GAF domain-containing protein